MGADPRRRHAYADLNVFGYLYIRRGRLGGSATGGGQFERRFTQLSPVVSLGGLKGSNSGDGSSGNFVVLKCREEVFRGNINSSNIHEIDFVMKLAEHVGMLSTSLEDWHERLGHVSMDVVKHMAENNIVEG